MLPKLSYNNYLDENYQAFLNRLKISGFKGDISTQLSDRMVLANDNSVYQVIPKIVVYPRGENDVINIFKLAGQKEFQSITFSARGGGTGTNGQSLSDGIIIDHSRYLTEIVELNLDKGYVEVQPGVVLDELNRFLKKHDVFFAPNLSPSDRATLGGMCNTDACGKGSVKYGRTSDHLLKIDCILANGEKVSFESVNDEQLNEIKSEDSIKAKIYQTIDEILTEHKEEIEKRFPKLKRFMTGYNLAKIYDQNTKNFNLNYLIAGSEGTLVTVSQLRLKLTPIPKYKVLFAIQYASFDRALRAGKELLLLNPTAIETIDDMILDLAVEDESYHKIKPLLERNNSSQKSPRGINLVEFITDSKEELTKLIGEINQKLENIQANDTNLIAFFGTIESSEINDLWDLRKKSVGLLGNLKGVKKPVPFMEDTLVPPEHLADYILELRALLDSYNLKYGMFGHVDVGCLHMRPALNMLNEKDHQLLEELTYKVSELVKKYGGVYWSEHGKGFRSELVKDYFGEILTEDLKKIKTVFDPFNQLNPGKITTTLNKNDQLVKINGPFRGNWDNQVSDQVRAKFGNIFYCNGNARCLNRDVDFTMCPSAKVSYNWAYSPKGRSTLLREWTRLAFENNYTNFKIEKISLSQTIKNLFNPKKDKNDFSYEVYQSMKKCLGCKACQTSCPVQVNIPQHRSLFLHHYHKRYKRSIQDRMIRIVEPLAFYQAKFPKIFNRINQSKLTKFAIKKIAKLDYLPFLSSVKLSTELKLRNAPIFSLDKIKNLTDQAKENLVFLVQDAFTSFYDAKVVLAVYDLLTKIGLSVYVLPFRENGKALHVKGFLNQFKRLAEKNTQFYNELSSYGIPLIGIEPTMVLCYRDEYVETLGKEKIQFKVHLLQEWLTEKLKTESINIRKIDSDKTFYLMGHCTERALVLTSNIQYQKLFEAFGLNLKSLNVGCCGMAGTFGHEVDNISDSKKLYEMSWKKQIEKMDNNLLMATGFSCRSQVSRFGSLKLKHPFEALLEEIR